ENQSLTQHPSVGCQYAELDESGWKIGAGHACRVFLRSQNTLCAIIDDPARAADNIESAVVILAQERTVGLHRKPDIGCIAVVYRDVDTFFLESRKLEGAAGTVG